MYDDMYYYDEGKFPGGPEAAAAHHQ
jgi:hypothetical protein